MSLRADSNPLGGAGMPHTRGFGQTGMSAPLKATSSPALKLSRRFPHALFFLLLPLFLSPLRAEPSNAAPVTKLPDANGSVVIQVQDDPSKPARPLTIHLRYPAKPKGAGTIANVSATTGLMLDLHNWGGVTFEGAPSPDKLANTFDVIAIGVQYYQSGDKDDPKDPVPYDFGYLQTMDALRALHFVYQSLIDTHHPFDHTRIYGTGGSGGGNVIQMCNKFAPRTFACIVDLSGMASLTDDIAFNLPGGANLNARYSRDKSSPAYLAPGMQEIRDLGNPAHLAQAAKLGNHCKVVVIHGEDDPSCLASDKRRVVEAMRAAGLDVESHFIAKGDADGKLIKNSAHSIGNRTELLMHFAGDYLSPASGKMCRLNGPSDFERREVISYPTTGGEHLISFRNGGPTLAFNKLLTP